MGEADLEAQRGIPVPGVEEGLQAHLLDVGRWHGKQGSVIQRTREADVCSESVASLQQQGYCGLFIRRDEVRDVGVPGREGAPVFPDEAAVDPQPGGLRGVLELQDDPVAGESCRDPDVPPQAYPPGDVPPGEAGGRRAHRRVAGIGCFTEKTVLRVGEAEPVVLQGQDLRRAARHGGGDGRDDRAGGFVRGKG